MGSSPTGITKAPLAQLVVAVVLHTTGHRFDPCRVHKKGSVEHLVGSLDCKSSPKGV